MSQPDLSQANVVVLVFVMDGCSACDEYLPVFKKIAAPYKQAGIPILIYDIGDDAPDAVDALAERFGVEATPTTVVARRGLPGYLKVEGDDGPAATKQLMDAALRAHRNG